MATATKTKPVAPTPLSEHAPWVAQRLILDDLRAQKAAGEERLAAALRLAREGASNREARVAALASGKAPPPIEPEADPQVGQAREHLEHLAEAITVAGDELRAIASAFYASCLNEIRGPRLEALRDYDAGLAALEEVTARVLALEEGLRDRGAAAATLMPGWFAPFSLAQLGQLRGVLREDARRHFGVEL